MTPATFARPRGRAFKTAAVAALLCAALSPALAQEPSPPPPDDIDIDIDIAPVTPEPVGPMVYDPYRVMLRPALWVALLNTSFSKQGSPALSLEGTFDASRFQVVFPVEVLARTENQEFRFRYMFWNEKASRYLTAASFGSATFANEKVDAVLNTDVFGADFLQRIVDKDAFDLYLSAGLDLFSTTVEVSGSSGAYDLIDETVPILTVGLGLRVRLKDELNLYVSNAALSYSQLLGMDEEFFGVRDTYRNIEVSLQWDRTDAFSWGLAWKHYEAGFESPRLGASQELQGVSAWFSHRF